ncbi:MAG: c-type cytochrome, partial [Burkholderiaceae bacterium]
IPIIGIILLVQYVTNERSTGAGSNSQSPEAIAERIQPVAEAGFTFRDANAPKQLMTGAEVYKAVCSACHATGAAGAPKVGDNGAWAPRIAEGYDTLVSHAVHGIRAMPAKGGTPDVDAVEVARAVVFMANQAGAKFKEPAVKAPATAAAGGTTESAGAATSAPASNTPTETAATPSPTAQPAAASAPAPAATPVAAPAADAVPADAGKKLYESVCIACHGAGLAGAPKFGDKAAWADRLKEGKPVLYEHALKGFQGKNGVMPPKGGSQASDAEVKAAVDYMAAAAK